MGTAVSEFYEPVRVILGDIDPVIRIYEDGSLGMGVRSAVRMGTLADHALSANKLEIDPAISDPNKFALLTYEVALMFARPAPDRYEFQIRAFRERFGSHQYFVQHLEDTIWTLRNGTTLFRTWTMYNTWFAGIYGVDLASMLTQVDVEAPVAQVKLHLGGATFSR